VNRLDSHTMYAVDLDASALPALDMAVWADDTGVMPTAIFASSHRITTFAASGGPGPDPHLHQLAASGWALFDDYAGWAEPAPVWSATLDVSSDRLTVLGPGEVPFYDGTLNSSKRWRRSARRARAFIALAGDIDHPRGIPRAQARGRMYALLCPLQVAA
jgi:hypothetical protein